MKYLILLLLSFAAYGEGSYDILTHDKVKCNIIHLKEHRYAVDFCNYPVVGLSRGTIARLNGRLCRLSNEMSYSKHSHYDRPVIRCVPFVTRSPATTKEHHTSRPEQPLSDYQITRLAVKSHHSSFGPLKNWTMLVKALAAVETRGHYKWSSRANKATGAKGVLQILQRHYDKLRDQYGMIGGARDLDNQAIMLKHLQLEANRLIKGIPGHETFHWKTIIILRASIHFGGRQQLNNLYFAYMLDDFFEGEDTFIVEGCCTKGWDYIIKVGAFLNWVSEFDLMGSTSNMVSFNEGLLLRKYIIRRGWRLEK